MVRFKMLSLDDNLLLKLLFILCAITKAVFWIETRFLVISIRFVFVILLTYTSISLTYQIPVVMFVAVGVVNFLKPNQKKISLNGFGRIMDFVSIVMPLFITIKEFVPIAIILQKENIIGEELRLKQKNKIFLIIIYMIVIFIISSYSIPQKMGSKPNVIKTYRDY